MERMTTTNSETATFRNCQQRWLFEYLDKLKPIRKSSYLSLGTAYHAALAHGYTWIQSNHGKAIESIVNEQIEHIIRISIGRGRTEFQKNFDEIKSTIENGNIFELESDFREDLKILEWMVEFYWIETMRELQYWVPVLIEYPFKVPLRDRLGRARHLYHEGVFDLVVFDTAWERLILVEHKTTSLIPYQFEKKFEFDPQCGGYLYALQEMLKNGQIIDPRSGESFDSKTPIGSVMYDVIRRKVPRAPKINQNGTVSTAQIDTLPEFYEAKLKEQETFKGVARSGKQIKILDTLQGRGHLSFFSRFEHHRPQTDINRWVREQYISARRMRSIRRNKDLCVRNERACNMIASPACPYRALCIDDTPDLRKANFRIATSDHEEIDEAKKGQTELWLNQ